MLISHKEMKIATLRKQELMEQQAEKLRDATFNEIKPIQPVKQIWWPKLDVITAPTTAPSPTMPAPIEDDREDEELLDYGESSMNANDASPTEGMDINMIFMLPSEFWLNGVVNQ